MPGLFLSSVLYCPVVSTAKAVVSTAEAVVSTANSPPWQGSLHFASVTSKYAKLTAGEPEGGG
ncbi:MAG: hypothetical protein WBF05_16215 [Anaerolineales bacterium]